MQSFFITTLLWIFSRCVDYVACIPINAIIYCSDEFSSFCMDTVVCKWTVDDVDYPRKFKEFKSSSAYACPNGFQIKSFLNLNDCNPKTTGYTSCDNDLKIWKLTDSTDKNNIIVYKASGDYAFVKLRSKVKNLYYACARPTHSSNKTYNCNNNMKLLKNFTISQNESDYALETTTVGVDEYYDINDTTSTTIQSTSTSSISDRSAFWTTWYTTRCRLEKRRRSNSNPDVYDIRYVEIENLEQCDKLDVSFAIQRQEVINIQQDVQIEIVKNTISSKVNDVNKSYKNSIAASSFFSYISIIAISVIFSLFLLLDIPRVIAYFTSMRRMQNTLPKKINVKPTEFIRMKPKTKFKQNTSKIVPLKKKRPAKTVKVTISNENSKKNVAPNFKSKNHFKNIKPKIVRQPLI